MTLSNIDMPFNKDGATIRQSKDALESIEQLFSEFQFLTSESSDGKLTDDDLYRLGNSVERIYKCWSRTYPVKGTQS